MSSADILEVGKTLLFASRDGDLPKVMEMCHRNAPFVNDWLGSNALHLACQNSHDKIVSYLLNAGISKDLRTKTEKTALHFAAQKGRSDIVEILLSKGANPNHPDMIGMTPLHWACQGQHYLCVKLLLKHKADPSVVSKFEKTPAQIADDLGNIDLFNLITNFSRTESKSRPEDLPLKQLPAKDTQCNETNKESKGHEGNEANKVQKKPAPSELTPPKTYSRKRKSRSKEESTAKRKIASKEAADTMLPFFQDSGSLSPSEAERQARTLRLLETHGIKMLPKDDSTIVASAVRNGQTVCLTEAGKMALKAIEIPSLSPSSMFNQNIAPLGSQEAGSPEKSPKKVQSQELVHVNSLKLDEKNSERKRVIKIRADQLVNLRKSNKVVIRATPKSAGKFSDSESELREALNIFKVNEPQNTFKIDESDFDDVVRQLGASQALVKLYRQQLISKEKELQMYKQLLQKTSNQLKILQQNSSQPV